MTKSNRRMRYLAAIGLLACAMVAITPLGCTSSAETVRLRYRAEHSGPYLPEFTVERLQACVEEYGGQLEADSNRVEAKVQVDDEGRMYDVQVTGIPASAPDFAGCTRAALREMAVPESVLELRQRQKASTANGQTAPKGNEVANPIVWAELAAELAELAMGHGGRTFLFTVTIEVLSAAAIAGTTVYLRKKDKDKKACQAHLTACLMTPTADKPGNHPGHSRCVACFDQCSDGKWPVSIPLDDGGSCYYNGQK